MTRFVYFAVAGIVWAGCSADPPPPARAPAVVRAGAPERVDPGPSLYESEIGGLNEEAMDRAFGALGPAVQSCFEDGMQRVDSLGGHFKLNLRIDRHGSTKWAYLSESTLGERTTEKCVLEAARSRAWPRPLGGEGLAEKSFDFDTPEGAATLDERHVRRDIARARKELAECRQGVGGRFVATAYVRADGRVLAAGVAAPNEHGEDVADCLVDAIRKVRFHGGARAAKVSFEIF